MLTLLFYCLIFLASLLAFYLSGELIVKSLIKVAKFLQWKEFVVSFVVMSVVASLPNLFVGIIAALHGIPQLSFGDVVGGNVVDLTLSVALAALFSTRGIPAKSKTIHGTLWFTVFTAALPLLLIWDGTLSRIDGVILIVFYFVYISWVFSKKERFQKVCEDEKELSAIKNFKSSVSGLLKIVLSVAIFLIAAEGIVTSAQYFANTFSVPLILIGLFIVGLGNCAPEIFFAISSARKENDWMILGDLMGAIVAPATLVLGLVALICPINVGGVSSFAIARLFTFIAILFFFIFIKNDSRISKKEAMILLFVYIAFIMTEVFTKNI
jgi:cation:H+ antiporter